MKLNNYLDLLIDGEIDSKTNCPVSLAGISTIVDGIYSDLKDNIPKGKLQKCLMRCCPPRTFYGWKTGEYPIPIKKLKDILFLWQSVCNKSDKEKMDLYNKAYQTATSFRAKCSPINVNIIKQIDKKIAYILGIIYADGSLRNIWLTFENEKRFRWEITVTDESSENLRTIVSLLEEIFGVKTNVKTVYGGRWHRILFQSMILHRLLNRMFEMPMGYKKGKLRIPEIIKNSSFDIKKYFVVGFFDGDGMCSIVNTNKKFTPVVSVSQSSKEILEELNEILREKNFDFRLYQKRSNGFVFYVLETKSKYQIKRFQDEFGFMYHNKKERLRELVNSFYNGTSKATKIFCSLVSQEDKS